MKRIWIAAALLAIMLGLCIGEQIYINSFCNGLDELIASAQEEPTKERLEAIHEYWNKKNDVLYAMCQHDMLDELSVSIHEMNNSQDEEAIKGALTDAKAQNYTFYENQKITLSNIA